MTTAATSLPATQVGTDDHPGRWIGGMIGALASVLVSGVGALLALTVDGFDGETLITIGLLGMPVGFVLGRAAMPWARSDGWGHAATMGLAIGLAAPPLGAIEVVLGMGATASQPSGSGGDLPALLTAPVLLIYAIPISFIAVIVTIPAGVVWGIAVRAVPDAWLRAARSPRWLSGLGVRHVLWLIAAVLVVLTVAQAA